MLKGIVRLSLAAFALILGVNLYGATIDQETAVQFAQNWLASEGNPVIEDGVAREVTGATPIVWEGATYGYGVNFAPAGYMVVSPDDRISPVLFYNGKGQFENNPAHPLFSLVIADVRTRLEVANAEAPEGETRGELPEFYQTAKNEWSSYLSNDTRALYTHTIEDIWVPVLSKTEWAQGSVTDANTGVTFACYNYWTPTPTPEGPAFEEGNPNNSVSGCSATTVAQVVAYYQWPQGRVGTKSHGVTMGNKTNMMQKTYNLTLNMMGGDGAGGPYDWSLMTKAPGVAKTDANYEPYSMENISMIGRLTRDAGVANGVNYFCNVGCETSGNASANSFSFFDMKATTAGSVSVLDTIRANLDAHRLVPISIWAAINLSEGSAGHSVFVDGYGLHNGRWFFHMNMGWGGGSNGWYNYDEHFASAWDKEDVQLNVANIYQNQKLQDNEDLNGSILSGRVTDANGQPVAGVKVSIRKKGETDTFLTMAAWYDRLDGVDCHSAVTPGEAGYGAEYYRNCTDAKGIWAIDKVAAGDYEIVLEKAGYTFLGDVAVSTTGKCNDKWGLNFVAMPDTISTLALTSWWTEGDFLKLQFNRAIGGVQFDGSKMSLNIGGNIYTLENREVFFAADSDIISINVKDLTIDGGTTLSIAAGALYYDVDGASIHDDIYNIPVVKVAPVVADKAQGTASASAPVVTAINRVNAFIAAGTQLSFQITASGEVDVNDFKVTVLDSYMGEEGSYGSVVGAQLPPTAIGELSGDILTVNVGEGYGFVRVDYIPVDGDAFLQGQTYMVDNAAPSILASEIKVESEKQFVYITFNKAVGGKDLLNSVAGVNVANDGKSYCSAENTTNGFVLYRKGAVDSPDSKFNADLDIMQWGGGLAENQVAADNFKAIKAADNGKIRLRADLSILGTYNIEAGYLRWVDVDGDGVFTLGTDAFIIQCCNEIMGLNGKKQSDLYKVEELSVTVYPSTYGPELKSAAEITQVTYTDQDTPVKQGQYWLGPGSAPTGTYDLYFMDTISDADLEKIAYYSTTGNKFPSVTDVVDGSSFDQSKIDGVKEFITTWAAEGSGAWIDRSVDPSTNYVAGQDTLILGNAVTDGFAGAPVVASSELYYVDLDLDGAVSTPDFIWLDNGDGKYTDPATAGDEIKGFADASQLNWRAPLTADDLRIILYRNGGTASGVTIKEITDRNGNPLTNASANIRCELDITPKVSATSRNSIPSGSEKIEIRPFADAIFDARGNVASETATTGELPLTAVGGLFVTSYKLTPDNGAIAISFSKRILGQASGVNPTALKNIAEDKRIFDNPEAPLKSSITAKNFTATVTYTDNTTANLMLTSSSTASYDMGLFHAEGSNYVVLNFMAGDVLMDNLSVLGASGKTVKSITIAFNGIYSYQKDVLSTASITVDANPVFNPGYAGLMPPMFTNRKGSYDFIHAPGCESGNPVPSPTVSELLTEFEKGYACQYCWTELADGGDGKNPTLIYQHDFTYDVEANEDGIDVAGGENGVMDLGMYYRDLDGDGRVDAVDMNFFNPWGHDLNYPAELQIGSDAKNNFIVWVYAPIEDEKGLKPGNEGISYGSFPQSDAYPLDNALKDANLYGLLESGKNPKGWIRAAVTGVEVIQQNANHSHHTGNTAQWASGKQDFIYSTVRVSFDQSNVPARTDGDRIVMVTYVTPRNDWKFYDGLLAEGYNAAPLKSEEKKIKDAGGTEHTATINKRFEDATNADEQLGIYWKRSVNESNSAKGTLHGIWVCHSFGPVVAWDGVAPQAVVAGAWRATPYRKPASANDPEDLSAYEFVDIRFSEPILGANDLAIYQGGCVSGYTASEESYSDLAYGPVGVTMLNEYTIRYRLQKGKYVTGTAFQFKGALYPMSSAMEHALGPGSAMNEYGQFDFTAPAIHPIPSSYQVLSSSKESVEVFKLENPTGGSLTTKVVVPSFSVGKVTGRENASFTAALTAKPYTAYTKSHGGGVSEAAAYTMRKQGGSFSNADATFKYDEASGIFTVAASDTSMHPGASFYASVSNMEVRNENLWGINVGRVWDVPGLGNTQAYASFGAPSATSFVTNDYSTTNLPANAILSGPLYVYGKAQAMEKKNTTRANVGEVLTVAGIDVAGPASYKLTGVKVRLVDTSNGAFDPAIALKPLADDASSGVLLWNVDTKSYVTLSNDKLEWSELQTTVEGNLFREVTLRPLGGVAMATTAGAPNSANFEIRVVPSTNFRYGSSFFAVIPDDGLFIGAYQSTDDYADTWGTPNGTKGYRLTDTRYLEVNKDYRWNAGEPLMNCEDTATAYSWHPYYDGGMFMDCFKASHSNYDLQQNGNGVREIYYAKKNGALNPETTPWTGLFGAYSVAGISTSGSDYDLEYNVSYAPGDDMWYDVGGTLGVYDAGIDIPILGNADKFMLPYAIQEFGARGAQFRAAAPAVTGDVSTGSFPAPCEEPMAILAVNMQDNSRGFGPHYVMDGAILVEAISKNMVSGTYDLVYNAAAGTLAFAGGDAVAVPAVVGQRVILTNAAKDAFAVVRRLNDIYDADEDGDYTEIVDMPAGDTITGITVGTESGRDIQQPAAITGVRVLAVGNDVKVGETTLTRSGTKLAWNGGASVDVSEAGTYVLYGAAQGNSNYIVVRTDVVGGTTSEKLMVYTANGPQSNPLEKITGVEIMAVGDMLTTGWYTISYDANAISFGNGGSAKLPAAGEFAIVYGDGTATDYSRSFIVVRRTAQALPTAATTDRIFVSQNQLYYVDVTLTSVNGVTPSHFKALTKGADSGISLWWDADSSGSFSAGDMAVPLLETPVFVGGGDTWTCALIPDPDFMTAWLSTPISGSFDNGYNFFVCVQSTIDMSFGDSFRMSASFLEPSEPWYDYNDYRNRNENIVFGTNPTGLNDNITRGTVYSYAEVVSKANSCTSVTNTIFAKTTVPNQAVDAAQLVPLTSITHWGKSSGAMPWVTKVGIDMVNMKGFEPETALQPMDAAKAADRGLILYKDANGNGVWDATDTVVNSTILMEQDSVDPDFYHFVFLLADESCTVANSDTKPAAQLFVVANMNDDLPFGVQFYGHMDADYITYNTSGGSGSSAIDTDVLTSTLNAMYTEVLGSEPFTTTGGILVQSAGKNVSGYQTIKLSYSLNGQYVISWNGNQYVITDFENTTTVTLGEGDNAITVTFDPRRFFAEDTLVYSADGQPVATVEGEKGLVAIGSKLVSLAGSATAFYTDVNGNGAFDSDIDVFNAGTNAFVAADNISFFDANENGVWDADEPAFFDTDAVYTLPWMAATLDTDSINTQGIGTREITLNEKKLDAVSSPAIGEETVAGRSYLYYVDMDDNANRNFDPRKDVVVTRLGTGSPVTAGDLALAVGDNVVLYPAYVEGEDEFDVAAHMGATLRPFNEGDYLWMNYVDESLGTYGMAKALMLSTKDTWEDMSFSWDFLVTPAHSIRRITPANASDDFKTAQSAMSAIIGLDFANNGATDIYLNSVKVRFYNVSGFAQEDLCTLTADENSGVQLWKDADGDGSFNPYKDLFVPLAAAPAWSQDNGASVLTLSPKSNNYIANELVDDIPDFFVVVIPSVTANNTELVDDGDKFYAVVKSSDVSLNKTTRQTSNLTSGTITIDSKAPVVEIITASSEDARLVDTLVMTFDEEMKRLSSADFSVWTVVDEVSGNPYDVTAFTLDDDAMGCTLKIAPQAGIEPEEYSTAAVKVTANFTTESALVDWAGNPAEIKGILATDKTSPVINSITYADLTIDAIGGASVAGMDGHVDTLLVTFSEAVIDSTFGETQWTINGVNMLKVDPGTTVLGTLDGLNDRYMVFRIETPDPAMDDTDAVVFDFGTIQTLTDVVNNVLVINDSYKVIGLQELVLLTAKPEGEEIYQEVDLSWTLPINAQIKLNFADEPKLDGAALSGITLIGGGKTIALDDSLCDATVEDNSVILTLKAAQTGFTESTGWTIQVSVPNTGIVSNEGDYPMAAVTVPLSVSVSPKIAVPVEEGFYYFASGTPAQFVPSITLNGAAAATQWKVEVYEASAGAITGEALFEQSGDDTDINLIDDDATDNLTVDGWYDAAIRSYIFRVTLLSAERGNDVIDVPFYALNEDDVFTAEVNEGIIMDRTGAPSSYRTTIIDQDTTHLILIDGGYTAGTATVQSDVFADAVIPTAVRTIEVTTSNPVDCTISGDVLTWSDETVSPQLVNNDTIVAKVIYKATDVDGNIQVIASGESYTYTLTTNHDLFACVVLTDGAYNDLVKPITWENNTSLYARIEKTDVHMYQWRVVPESGAPGMQPWSLSGELANGRTRFGWAKLDDNTVLVAGGYPGTTSALDTTEVYDAINGIWSASDALNTAAYDNVLVALADGTALSLGGQNADGKLNAIELYKDGSWTVAGELAEGKAMVSAIRNAEKVYAVGGYLGGPTYVDAIEVIEVVDGVATATVAENALTTARGSAALFLQTDRLVVVGGKNSSGAIADAEAVEVAADGSLGAVSALTGLPAIANASYVQDTDGTIWVIGGKNSTATYFLKDGESTWTAGPELLDKHENGAAICIDGLLLAVGGADTYTTETLDYAAYALDPSTAWTANTDLATADSTRKLFALTEVNGGAFAFGGQVASAYTTTSERRLASWSQWIGANPGFYENNIAILGLSLTEGESYILQVRTKDTADVVSDILSTTSFAVGAPSGTLPVATIVSAKVGGNDIANGAGTMSDEIVFTFAGDANTVSYRFVVDGSTFTTSETYALMSDFTVGEHTLALYAIDAKGAIQEEPDTFTWTLMDCAITSDAVVDGGVTALTEDLLFTVQSGAAQYYRYTLDDAVMPTTGAIDIATAIELDALTAGAHTLRVWVAVSEDSFIADEVTAFSFTVDAVAVTPTESVDFSTSRTINVTYGMLTKYEWSLDDAEAVLVDPAEATIELTDLSNGTHSLLVWGIDAAGNKQTTAAESTIVVQSAVGDRLNAQLTADAASAPADADISFELAFSNEAGDTVQVAAAPKAADFTVTNGTIAEVVANDGFGYTVKVTPDTVAAGSTKLVTLKLEEGKVFDEDGHGNVASAEAKTVVYGVDADPETDDKLLSFNVELFSDEDCTVAITDTDLLTNVYAKVSVSAPADRAMTGADVVLSFDTDKFQLVVDDPIVPEDIILAPYNFTDAGTSKTFAVAELVKDGDEVTGIRLGGSVADPATALSGDFALAVLKFNAIAIGEASENDFVLSAGTAMVGLVDVKPIANDDASIGYGAAELEVNDAIATLTLTAVPTAQVEGNDIELTATLSYALTDDITILVKADNEDIEDVELFIAAGDTSASETVTLTDDMVGAGDYDVVFTVDSVTPATEGGAAPEAGASVTVNVTDSAAKVTLSLSIATAAEGNTLQLTANLSAAVAEELTILVKADKEGIDDIELTVFAGDFSSPLCDVDIPDDKLLTGDYDITFTVDSVTPAVGAIPVPAAGATAVLAVEDAAINTAVFTVTDEAGNPITSVKEGEKFRVNVALSDDNVAGGEVKFAYTFGGDAVKGVTYTYEDVLGFTDGATEGYDTFTTYFDNVVGTDYSLDIDITGMTIDGNAVSAFTTVNVATAFEILDNDQMRADFNGDGIIDITDVTIFIYYYGTEDDGSEGWAACDFNGDGVLDITDVTYFIYFYDSKETRGDTRAELPNLSFWLDCDEDSFQVGEEFTVTLMACCEGGEFGSAYAHVSWDPEVFEVVAPLTNTGALDLTQACNTQLFDVANGVLNAEEGIVTKLGSSAYTKRYAGAQWVGKLTFKALKACDQATIALSNFDGSGTGWMVSNKTATATGDDFTCVVEEGSADKGFILDIEGVWQQSETRAVSQVCLTIGETDDETKEDVEWQEPGQGDAYSIYIVDDAAVVAERKLSADYRDLNDGTEVWKVRFKNTSETNELVLNWDASDIEDYDLTLVIDNDRIDMKATSTITLTEDEDFQIEAQPHIELVEFTYSDLLKGWNLLGAVFALDEEAQGVFGDAGATLYVYDGNAQIEVEPGEPIAAGQAFWAWFEQAPENGVTVVGVPAENPAGVEIKRGWNMVAPLYNTAELTLPESPRVWIWGQYGYAWINEDSDVKLGQGYWFESKEDTTIWETSAE